MSPHPNDLRGTTTEYRIVVEGRIGAGWAGWFGADAVVPGDGTTELRVRVADEAELHGRLRRIRDLRLRLLSLVLLRSDDRDEPPGSGPGPHLDFERGLP